MRRAITGASASASFVSCRRSTSGAARSSHQSTLSSLAAGEVTVPGASRMSAGRPALPLQTRADGDLHVALERARNRATVLRPFGGVGERRLGGSLHAAPYLEMARGDAPARLVPGESGPRR